MNQGPEKMSEENEDSDLLNSYKLLTHNRYAEAKELLSKLIASDLTGFAALYLGSMYYFGHGVGVDTAVAEQYFRQAADKGVESAKFNLGSICERRGEVSDAFSWYYPLAQSGDPASMQKIYKLSGKYPDLNLGRDQALSFLERSAAAGYAYAKRDLQRLELSGKLGFIRQIRAVFLFPIVTIGIITSLSQHFSDKDIKISSS